MVFLGIYRAIYDYAPQSGNEIALSEGDLLMVLEKSAEDDWWKAKKKVPPDDEEEPEGLIPNNYIEEVSLEPTPRRLRGIYNLPCHTCDFAPLWRHGHVFAGVEPYSECCSTVLTEISHLGHSHSESQSPLRLHSTDRRGIVVQGRCYS